MFQQYKGLPRDNYILFFGKTMTSMGSLIWPMMTLILSNKMHMSASQIANLIFVFTLVQITLNLMGGTLADRFSRKYIIIICDLITVICYLICFFIPLSLYSIICMFIAASAQGMEHPSYDALVADSTSYQDRERAYSLNYMGMNVGLVLAPSIGGMLFEHHLNIAFLINAIAILSSTFVIFFFFNGKQVNIKNENIYEEKSDKSLHNILMEHKIWFLFLLCEGIYSLLYSQFNYLIPLAIESYHPNNGAKIFGFLTSINAIVVIIFTPFFTNWFVRIMDISKFFIGTLLLILSYVIYLIANESIPFYFIGIVILTFGEIITTLYKQPYVSKRIAQSHRGRITSLVYLFTSLFQGTSQMIVGFIIDASSYTVAWIVILIIGLSLLIMIIRLMQIDKSTYPLLYREKTKK